MMTRSLLIAKNIVFGYVANIIAILINFISRTVFIYTLGDTYLGVSGLFGNILGILSFAELGIGTAMNYALYKPVAEQDILKIKSLMEFYKKSYRVIAAVVAIIGIAICPFLKYIVHDNNGVLQGNGLYVYYLIFLFNTVTSYFVTYKFSLVNAEQKNYIFTTINMLTNLLTVVFQIIVLLIFEDFMAYLLTASAINTLQKIGVSIYLRKLYPYLSKKNADKLDYEELTSIKKNVKALIIHKIGEISVYQTDNIIISLFEGIKTVGYVSNYTLIISSVTSFVGVIFNSAVSSFGNLMTENNTNKQYELFRCYKFLGFWVYGFCSIALTVLMSPFITLWIGGGRTVEFFAVILLVMDFYLVGQRICLNNVKVAAGVFWKDRYVAFVQAAVNLIVSIVMIKKIGLPGVFVGTIVQGLISTVIKPIIVYKELFKKSALMYFFQGLGHLTTTLTAGGICYGICNILLAKITITHFIMAMGVVIIIPNIFFYMIYGRSKEFSYLCVVIKGVIKR